MAISIVDLHSGIGLNFGCERAFDGSRTLHAHNLSGLLLDFRSDALPGAKYAAARGRRKFTAEEQEARKVVAVEGPGAIKGAFASEVEADAAMQVDDGEETASLFVEDTTPVENADIVE